MAQQTTIETPEAPAKEAGNQAPTAQKQQMPQPEELVSPEEVEVFSTDRGAVFLSPEGLIMMSIAVFIDAGELFAGFVPGAGPFISTALDIAGFIIIGGWLFFRSQLRDSQTPKIPRKRGKGEIKALVKSASKVEKKVGKAARWAKRLKWLRPLLILLEVFPLFEFMPDFIFGWTIAVYLELRYG
jgi:hypothetical protein